MRRARTDSQPPLRRATRRWAAAGVSALAVAAASVVATLPMDSAAFADIASPYFAANTNLSDPHIIACPNPSGDGHVGYCLYTSKDLGTGETPANAYPMNQTQLYYSSNGFSNWTFKGVVAAETDIDVAHGGWVPTGANHLWAPAAVHAGDDYYLYVPDVSDIDDTGTPNIHTSSRINVWKFAGTPFGARTNLGFVSSTSGYMSDPDVLIDGANRYLYWADGDNSSCGGFKSAKLNADMKTLTPNTTTTITIAGLPTTAPYALGTCTQRSDLGGANVGRPYYEGASIYKSSINPGLPSSYVMVFALKPTVTPFECTAANTGGGADTANEVIAYATASTPQGTFTYQGILMCGSTTEWTNQATLLRMQHVLGEVSGNWVMVYHDGPSAPAGVEPNRKLHAACLWVGEGKIAGVRRAPATEANSFNDCMAGANSDYRPMSVKPKDTNNPVPTPRLVTAATNSPHTTATNRYVVGPNERWRRESAGGQNFVLRNLRTGKLLCAPNNLATDVLTASCTAVDAKSTFTFFAFGDTNTQIRHVSLNKYISLDANGLLHADQGAPSARFSFYRVV